MIPVMTTTPLDDTQHTPETDYVFVCIADLTCYPESHSRRCHAINDSERSHFYRDLLIEQTVARTVELCEEAGMPLAGWQSRRLSEMFREHIRLLPTGQVIIESETRRTLD